MSNNPRGRDFITPVGRIVWGHPAKSQIKKNLQTNQPIINEKTGQPAIQWAFGVAFNKAEFEQFIWPHLFAEAATGYPNGVPPGFSYKYLDGDSIDKQGKSYAERDGYRGCYVLTLSTELQAPEICTMIGSTNGMFRQLDEKGIKTGDFVCLRVNCSVNVPQLRTHTPSLYVNPVIVELMAYGEEIRQGIDVNVAMRQERPPVNLPPGASLTPGAASAPAMGAPGSAMPPGGGAGMAHGGMPPGTTVQPHAAPQQPGALPPPHTEFVQSATGMQATGQQPGVAPGMAHGAPGSHPHIPGRMPGQ